MFFFYCVLKIKHEFSGTWQQYSGQLFYKMSGFDNGVSTKITDRRQTTNELLIQYT